MICPKCKTELSAQTPFCPFCGEKLGQQPKNDHEDLSKKACANLFGANFAEKHEKQNDAESIESPNEPIANPKNETNDSDAFYPSVSKDPLKPLHQPFPMKWYNFLIYFVLLAGSIIYVLRAVSFFTGYLYQAKGLDREYISIFYECFPAVRVADILYGIILLFLGVFSIVVRFALKKYQRRAPRFLMIHYLIQTIADPLYCLSIFWICNGYGLEIKFDFQCIGRVVVYIFYLLANYRYFKRRESLFIN